MHAAIVELDPLADTVGAAAKDDDLAFTGWIGLALGLGRAVAAFVGRIHVRRQRRELGGAGVDALEHGPDLEAGAEPAYPLLRYAAKGGDARIGKTLALEPGKAGAIAGQAVRAQFLLGLHQFLDLGQEPRIVFASVVDLLDIEAEAESLGDDQEPVRRRRPQRLAHDVAVGPAGGARYLDLVEARQVRLHGPQRLLQGLGETPPDRHGLAHRLHRCVQQGLGAGELLEGEARHLGDDVIDGGLEGCRGDAGDVVVELIEGVAHRQLGRDLGDGEAGRLGGEGGGARYPGVHLDHHHASGGGIDGELDVRSAGIDADLAQHRDGGVAHDLVLLVGQGQRRRHGDRIAGVDAHRVDVLDRADDDAVVPLVADHLHLEFLPAEHRFLDQDLMGRRGIEAAGDDGVELVAVIGDAGAGAAKGIARADDGRQAGVLERPPRLIHIVGDPALGTFEADAGHGLAEQLPVLRLVDRFLGRADHLDAVFPEGAVGGERQRHVQPGLPAHGRQQGVRPFPVDDLGQHLGRDRLDIGGVREARVGHDGGGVGVDQDHPVALGRQRLASLGARIVELAALADDDRPGADDEDRFDVRAFGHG